MDETPEKIFRLKSDLTNKKLSLEEIFQKHIVDGNSYFFEHYLKNSEKEYQIKSLIASYLGCHLHEIIIVGSAKLGYSLNPRNLYSKFDSKYNSTKENKHKSDLDIAIVSSTLFNQISQNIFDYTNSFNDKWKENEYYFGERLKDFQVPLCFKYFEYFSKGWFRPDMKPRGYEFCVEKTFEELKRELFGNLRRKTGLGIYQNWHFFKSYHMNNLRNLHFLLETETL